MGQRDVSRFLFILHLGARVCLYPNAAVKKGVSSYDLALIIQQRLPKESETLQSDLGGGGVSLSM
ncbi:hypothetical protein J27TS7_53980 [Paenibacillus dendritiformis]|nr:hypothetical protein J27TS7_53980 [Paenibacillus dendritiformis]